MLKRNECDDFEQKKVSNDDVIHYSIPHIINRSRLRIKNTLILMTAKQILVNRQTLNEGLGKSEGKIDSDLRKMF